MRPMHHRLIALAMSFAAAGPAIAQQPPPVYAPPRADLNRMHLQTLRSEQNRVLDQYQQNLNRQQDRQMNTQPILRPDVPVARPPCVNLNGLPQRC